MELLRRFSPFLGSLLLAACYSGLLLRILEWKGWVIGIGIVTILVPLFLLAWKWKSASFWFALFPILAFITGGTGLIFFLDKPFYQWLFALLLVVIFAVYSENLYTFHHQPHKYTTLSLPNLSFYIGTFTGFSLFAFLFALNLIRIIPVWVIVLAAFVYTVGMLMHMLRSYNIWHIQHSAAVAFIALLAAEAVWVLQYWPTAFFINGIIVAVLLYSIPSLLRLKLRDTLTKRAVFQYVVVSLLAIAGVLSTSQWT